MRRNGRKLEVLGWFARRSEWARPEELAHAGGWASYETSRWTSLYTYLLRLHRFGLLDRSQTRAGVYYRINPAGLARLAHLRAQMF